MSNSAMKTFGPLPGTLLLAMMLYLPAFTWGNAKEQTGDCLVTLPADWPTADVPMNGGKTHAWYGGGNLAALIPSDGIWRGLGPERNYFNKFWWWRRGYDAREEPQPDLAISAVRLDGPAPPV